MRPILLALLLAIPLCSSAIEFEKADVVQITETGDTSTIMIDGTAYLFWRIPDELLQFEASPDLPEKYKAEMARIPIGDPVSLEDATKVIEAYYKKTAFEFDSLKVRKLAVIGGRYVTWCTDFLVTCLSHAHRAGTWVEFEVNGKNRSGGMTGFEPVKILVTKVPASAAPEAVASQAAMQGQDIGRIPVATFDLLKKELSEGFAVNVDKSPEEIIEAARQALEEEGFTIRPGAGAPNTLYTSARKMKLTKKEADCGKMLGMGYIGDSRTESTVLIAVTGQQGSVTVQVAIDGILRVNLPFGSGAGDKALICRSTGAMERDLANSVASKL
jgi:hypothetical protein